jgi:hypothetical protein
MKKKVIRAQQNLLLLEKGAFDEETDESFTGPFIAM